MTELTREDFIEFYNRIKDLQPLTETKVLLSQIIDGKVRISILSTKNRKKEVEEKMRVVCISVEDLPKVVRGEMFPLNEFLPETDRKEFAKGILGVHVGKDESVQYVVDYPYLNNKD